MTRKKFSNILNEEVKKINDNNKMLYDGFFMVNEISPDSLFQEQMILKNDVLDLFKRDNEAKEKYYIYHLNRTIDTKWKQIDLDKIVNHFYKNSKKIKDIYDGVK